MKVYHYTNKKFYQEISDSDKELTPSNYLIHKRMEGLPAKAYDPVTCALLSPRPKEWVNNEDFPWIWDLLQRHLKSNHDGSPKILLRFNLVSKDDAYVFERKYLERNRKSLVRGTCSYEKHLADCKKFFDSGIPALDYSGGFNLPEVVIFSPVSSERINIVSKWELFRKRFFKN